MEENRIICVSIVVNFSNRTILIASSSNAKDMLLSGIKKTAESAVQCVIRITTEATGLVVKNSKEAACIKVKMPDADDNYEVIFFVSTDFSGSFRNSSNADLAWPKENEVKTAQEIYKTVMPDILSGKYVRGTYNSKCNKFISKEIGNEWKICDELSS